MGRETQTICSGLSLRNGLTRCTGMRPCSLVARSRVLKFLATNNSLVRGEASGFGDIARPRDCLQEAYGLHGDRSGNPSTRVPGAVSVAERGPSSTHESRASGHMIFGGGEWLNRLAGVEQAVASDRLQTLCERTAGCKRPSPEDTTGASQLGRLSRGVSKHVPLSSETYWKTHAMMHHFQ